MKLRTALLLSTLLAGPVHARTAFIADYPGYYQTPPVQTTQSVSLRSTYPANVSPTTVTAGGTFRQYYEVAATGPVRNVRVCYQNIQSANNTEADGPDSMSGVTASLEISDGAVAPFLLSAISRIIPLTFNIGQPSIGSLAQNGGEICSDKAWLTLVPGQGFYVRTYAPPGRQYAAYQGLRSTLTEYANNGSFAAVVTTMLGDGVRTTFTDTISTATTTGSAGLNIVLPLRANTIHIVGGAIVANDDGAGNLVGTGVASGTINYATGGFTLVASAAPTNGTGFVASGLSRGNQTAPDDTNVKIPTAFNTSVFAGWLPQYIPTLGPVAILGDVGAEAPPQHTLCIVGDSILSAGGNANENKTYAEYMSNSLGVIRIGQGGERAFDFAQTAFSFRRMKTVVPGRCSRVLTDYGSNDITGAQPLATTQANLLAVWAKLAAVLPNGFHDITQATITPYTASAVSNVPIDNTLYGPGTVVSGTPSLRNAVNAWICTQVGVTIGAILDVNTVLENAPNSCAGAGDGTWKSLTYTQDGRHWTFLAQKTTIPAVFGPTGSSPAPVFAP